MTVLDHPNTGRALRHAGPKGADHSPPAFQTALHAAGDLQRAEAEAFLEGVYARTFDGLIRRHYPTLMTVSDADGAIRGVVGFRFADSGPLFLEQYLDVPIEDAIDEALEARLQRAAIVEIGNLAGDDHRASLVLFKTLASHLLARGASHAVATATRQLRRRFRRIGVVTKSLARAEPGRLAAGAAEWGAYYGREPEVLAGAIRQTATHRCGVGAVR